MEEKLQAERQDWDDGQVVPVGEAIRYRKRAQAAEQQVEKLSQELSDVQREFATVKERLDEQSRESGLVESLVKAEVNDMEVGRLLARQRMADVEGKDVEKVIEELKAERPGLFGKDFRLSGVLGPTAGVRQGAETGRAALSRLAEKAGDSRSRKDLQEYMRLRRGMIV